MWRCVCTHSARLQLPSLAALPCTPLLAQIRENNKAAAPFGPTDGEKRFGPIFDQAVADSMSRPDRFPMVKAVERSILQRIELAEQRDQR